MGHLKIYQTIIQLHEQNTIKMRKKQSLKKELEILGLTEEVAEGLGRVRKEGPGRSGLYCEIT